VVNVPAWHAKIAIDPATYKPSAASAHRSEGVDLLMWIGSTPTAPASYTGTGLRPYSAATVRAHGLAQSDPTRGKTISLVPDGVASVTLQPIRLTPPQIAPGVQQPPAVQAGDFASVTAAVHDNVAPFELELTVTEELEARVEVNRGGPATLLSDEELARKFRRQRRKVPPGGARGRARGPNARPS
jgi:hypothetical protein